MILVLLYIYIIYRWIEYRWNIHINIIYILHSNIMRWMEDKWDIISIYREYTYSLVSQNIAQYSYWRWSIKNHLGMISFTHNPWWFAIVVLNYRMGTLLYRTMTTMQRILWCPMFGFVHKSGQPLNKINFVQHCQKLSEQNTCIEFAHTIFALCLFF